MKRNIENMYIWKESRVLVNDVYSMMKKCHDYSFKDQIQRASISVMNNIAEGAESGTDAKFINFLNISRGSCSEIHSMLYLCEDFSYCSTEERLKIQKQIKLISVGIVKLIDYISNNKRLDDLITYLVTR
ncbi:MAG: four helix bundle protein [Bacteroidales bacterium]|nr:four helix bundle protein [Bacteroidales bacterium]